MFAALSSGTPLGAGFHSLQRRLQTHFLFQIGRASIAYCYIRKNACSAFKRLLLDQAGYDGEMDSSLDFLVSRYAAKDLRSVLTADWRVFVYRDPFDRTVSLFRNKMVMANGARDFLRSYKNVTGIDPANATFNDFVLHYLPSRVLDPHAYSQISSLLPLRYNRICTLQTLAEDMRPIIGDELTERYFARRTNTSSSVLFDEQSADVPVGILRERYRLTGELPSDAALESEFLRSRVRQLYRFDYILAPRNRRSSVHQR